MPIMMSLSFIVIFDTGNFIINENHVEIFMELFLKWLPYILA
jgi:hypothetical protein